MIERLATASVQYGDWTGTAAADNHLTVGHRDVYEVAGLDPEKWWILSIDIFGLEDSGFYVYALDRLTTEIANYDGLHSYAEQHGSLPVTNFEVHGVSAATLLGESFTQFHLQLRSRALGPSGIDLDVTSLDDLNYVED